MPVKKIYEIRAQNVGPTKYPWAAFWQGPLKNMPFFDDFPEPLKVQMLESWERKDLEPGIYIDSGSSSWSDIVGCGTMFPSQFFSERIINDLHESGVQYHRATWIPIAGNDSKSLRPVEGPKYYVLEAMPGISRDYHAMGLELGEEGNPIFTNRLKIPKIICDASSWNGGDLFCFHNSATKLGLLCTEKVRELAKTMKWTNVEFRPIDLRNS